MTIKQFLNELKHHSYFVAQEDEGGVIRCKNGDCPIIFLHKKKYGVESSYIWAGEQLGLDNFSIFAIAMTADNAKQSVYYSESLRHDLLDACNLLRPL